MGTMYGSALDEPERGRLPGASAARESSHVDGTAGHNGAGHDLDMRQIIYASSKDKPVIAGRSKS